MTTHGPGRVYQGISDGFLRYIDTALWLRDENLRAERLELLAREGRLFTEPLLEPLPPHTPRVTLDEAIKDSTSDSDLGRALGGVVFGGDGSSALYGHQVEALQTALSDANTSRNFVVTAGTGAGKTECFLLPIFARLLTESKGWGDQPPDNRWWDHAASGSWRDSRYRSKRPAAMRAMILYPTNALVEDQMGRLRQAIRRARNLHAPAPLYFGRYTRATIGGQDLPTQIRNQRVQEVAEHLRSMESDRDAIGDADDGLVAQLPDPRDGEMTTRMGHDRVSTRCPGHELLDAKRHAHARERGGALRSDSGLAAGRTSLGFSLLSWTSCTCIEALPGARSGSLLGTCSSA